MSVRNKKGKIHSVEFYDDNTHTRKTALVEYVGGQFPLQIILFDTAREVGGIALSRSELETLKEMIEGVL